MNTRFDPFLHGTNSSALPLLKRTEFKIMSPTKMMADYSLAPLSGEIAGLWGGGHSALDSYSEVCFGRLHAAPMPKAYDLDYIIDLYAHKSGLGGIPSSAKELSNEFVTSSFENINVFFIELAREALLGDLSLTVDELGEIRKVINAGIQTYRLLALIGASIHPDFEMSAKLIRKLESQVQPNETFFGEFKRSKERRIQMGIDVDKAYSTSDENEQYKKYIADVKKTQGGYFYGAVMTHLTLDAIFERVKNSELNLPENSNDVSDSQLKTALLVLSFPDYKGKIVNMHTNKVSETTFSERAFFTTQKPVYPDVNKNQNIQLFRYAANSPGYCLCYLFNDIFSQSLSENKMLEFSKIVTDRADILRNKLDIFDRLVERIQAKEYVLNRDELASIKEPYPVVLMTSTEKIQPFDSSPIEYRAKEPLIIGKDITMLATDNAEHQSQLVDCLRSNGLANVKVITFEQLRECKRTGSEPIISASVSTSAFSLHAPIREEHSKERADQTIQSNPSDSKNKKI